MGESLLKKRGIVLLFFCLLFVFISFSCKSKKEETKVFNLTFNIDSSQIGSEVVLKDYAISFNPPANFVHSDEMLDKLNKNISNNINKQNGYNTSPLDAFIDKSLNVLVVSGISAPSADTANFSLQQVSGTIKDQFKTSNMKFAAFKKDDIIIHQFLIQDSINVVFKLLFCNAANRVIQFDYIIPGNNYKNEIKAIESSIGSIKKIR